MPHSSPLHWHKVRMDKTDRARMDRDRAGPVAQAVLAVDRAVLADPVDRAAVEAGGVDSVDLAGEAPADQAACSGEALAAVSMDCWTTPPSRKT